VIESFGVEQVALLTFSRWVANHARRTTHKDYGLVAATLQVTEHHDATKMADVETVGCGVGAKICRHHSLVKKFLCSRHDLSEHATPFQFFYKIFYHRMDSFVVPNKY
jgi:hypothetical protein